MDSEMTRQISPALETAAPKNPKRGATREEQEGERSENKKLGRGTEGNKCTGGTKRTA